jgi:hypothetical protein
MAILTVIVGAWGEMFIPDPGSKNNNKSGGGWISFLTFFCFQKFHKIVNN